MLFDNATITWYDGNSNTNEWENYMSNDPDRAAINARITNVVNDKSIDEDEKIRLIIDIVDEITEELLSRDNEYDEQNALIDKLSKVGNQDVLARSLDRYVDSLIAGGFLKA